MTKHPNFGYIPYFEANPVAKNQLHLLLSQAQEFKALHSARNREEQLKSEKREICQEMEVAVDFDSILVAELSHFLRVKDASNIFIGEIPMFAGRPPLLPR